MSNHTSVKILLPEVCIVKTALLGSAYAQGANWMDRLRGNKIKLPGTKHTMPWGVVPLVAGGALVGALGHGAGQTAAKTTLEDAGSTPEEIARADYLAKHPKSGYGVGGALGAGMAGAAAGVGTNLALQRFTGVNPGMARGLGLGAGLGAA